jgi:hypothetical protein
MPLSKCGTDDDAVVMEVEKQQTCETSKSNSYGDTNEAH